MNTKLIAMLSLTLSIVAYGAAYDTYSLKSDEIRGKNRLCYYENSRGDGYTITLPKSKQCKRYIKFS